MQSSKKRKISRGRNKKCNSASKQQTRKRRSTAAPVRGTFTSSSSFLTLSPVVDESDYTPSFNMRRENYVPRRIESSSTLRKVVSQNIFGKMIHKTQKKINMIRENILNSLFPFRKLSIDLQSQLDWQHEHLLEVTSHNAQLEYMLNEAKDDIVELRTNHAKEIENLKNTQASKAVASTQTDEKLLRVAISKPKRSRNAHTQTIPRIFETAGVQTDKTCRNPLLLPASQKKSKCTRGNGTRNHVRKLSPIAFLPKKTIATQTPNPQRDKRTFASAAKNMSPLAFENSLFTKCDNEVQSDVQSQNHALNSNQSQNVYHSSTQVDNTTSIVAVTQTMMMPPPPPPPPPPPSSSFTLKGTHKLVQSPLKSQSNFQSLAACLTQANLQRAALKPRNGNSLLSSPSCKQKGSQLSEKNSILLEAKTVQQARKSLKKTTAIRSPGGTPVKAQRSGGSYGLMVGYRNLKESFSFGWFQKLNHNHNVNLI